MGLRASGGCGPFFIGPTKPGAMTSRATATETIRALPRVDRRSVVLDQPNGPAIVIVIDDNTDFVDASGRTISEGIAGLHEGQQVRASMDRSSNHADRVQVTRDAKTQR